MNSFKKIGLIVAIVFAAHTVSPTLMAQTTNAYRIDSGGWTAGTGNWVLGFEFNITNTISVSYLGIADWYNNGLSGAAQVGIWNTNGSLLASVTVPTGTGADLTMFETLTYYFEALATPLTLTPGNYVIANQHTTVTGSQIFGYYGNMTWNPEITWVAGRAQSGTTFVYPTAITNTVDYTYIGPQLRFEVVTIPEPSSLMLVGLGCLGLMAWRRRRN